MFYNHEILTSRKHGVATVWLVATLGNRSNLRKVSRKNILEVDVPKACETILHPDAPMALRLQSSLLFGVSRVYSEQCGYVLADAQSVQAAMRHMIKAVRRQAEQQLDPEAGRSARPDQLLLSDDPNFLPDLHLNLDLDLSNLELTTDASGRSESVLSPHSKHSSRSSQSSFPNIIIPGGSSNSGNTGGLGGLDFPVDDSVLRDTAQAGLGQFDMDDNGFLPDADFSFDQDGNLILEDPGSAQAGLQSDHRVRSRAASDTSAGARVQQDLEGVNRERSQQVIDDMDLDNFNLPQLEDDQTLPDAEPFPSRLSRAQDQSPNGSFPTHETTESIEAGAGQLRRKPRRPKLLFADKIKQIRSTEMIAWNKDYLINMAESKKKKTHLKNLALAKSNAQWFVWGAGIGNIGFEMRGTAIKHPLHTFCGQSLKDLLLGSTNQANVGRKRDRAHDEDDDEQEENRRIRRRSEQEVARGEHEEDGFAMAMDDDMPLEVGRDAPTPLAGDDGTDASSMMPWNLSASGSRTRTRGSTPLSALVQRQQRRRPPVLSPIKSRRAEAPPERFESMEPLELGAGAASSSVQGVGDEGPVLVSDGDEGGRSGAVASPWLNRQLDIESGNFLEFVQNAINEHGVARPIERGDDTDEHEYANAGGQRVGITFEQLLVPETTTHVVAAQGLLHVLTLASKRLLWVEQGDGFCESIWLGEDHGVAGVGAMTHDA